MKVCGLCMTWNVTNWVAIGKTTSDVNKLFLFLLLFHLQLESEIVYHSVLYCPIRLCLRVYLYSLSTLHYYPLLFYVFHCALCKRFIEKAMF